MTALDIIVLILVGGVGVRGLMRGFVAEAMSLVAWIAAIAAVKLLHTPVAAALAKPVGTQGGAAVLAFAVIFGLTFLAGRMVANRMGSASRSSALGGFDRLLGFGFGAMKGLIGATLIFLLASLVYNTFYGGQADRPGWMTDSRTYPLLNATSRALVDFVEQRQNAGDPDPKKT
ncbi:MAG: CvpA family protein [Sphingomonadaceae bacterium]